MKSCGIAGTGFYVPERILTNRELSESVDTTDAWIQEKLGIKERRIADSNQALSDLAFPASVAALRDAGISSQDLDLIIVCAINHDSRVPSTASILQRLLGAKNAAAIDMNVGGCPGTCYSLVVGEQFIENGYYNNVLVVSGDIYSTLIDMKDRNVASYFGDGVGAAVLRPCKNGCGFLASTIGSDGESGFGKTIINGGSRVPYSSQAEKEGKFKITLDNKSIWAFGISVFPKTIIQVTQKAGYKVEDIDWVIPHQANINMVRYGMNKLGLPFERAYTNMQRYANTGAGSVMIALAEARELGLILPGQIVALLSFGAGFEWGSVLIKWPFPEDFKV